MIAPIGVSVVIKGSGEIEPPKWETLMNPYVKCVRPLADYQLEPEFENGEQREFDAKPHQAIASAFVLAADRRG